ncbi:anaerobic ribonucleoside-triphosphate reductase activating protein [Aliidiomarina celeris]|uniref:anaerobic ribonucleoside-triphosphate reductase activating protein n=1 Tax=Aliidiomarina celeris TaxID=2249428 RepID=UPI000DEA88C6|nr:anaerobic ribonucleoside-triphosphate reductase activating protein [Aliidiomarina celeris]
MRFSSEQVCFQEVPGEISLGYVITGCPVGCKGCHSADTWSAEKGQPLTVSHFEQRLTDYQGLISCVLFLGGEWHPERLIELLKRARQRHLTTCLYSGYHDIHPSIKTQLTYLKLGPWRPELGGLNSLTTNQRFYDLRTGACLNHKFQQSTITTKEHSHATTER